MIASDCLMAAILLTSSAELPLPAESSVWAQVCRTSLLTLALEAQILDPRENLDYLRSPADVRSDLLALQTRFREVAFAPLAEESLRFPDRDTVLDFLAYNRAYRHDVQARQALEPHRAADLAAALTEADQLHSIWCAVADARWGALYVTARRQAMQTLLDRVGPEAFYSGQLPTYVPIWRIPAAR